MVVVVVVVSVVGVVAFRGGIRAPCLQPASLDEGGVSSEVDAAAYAAVSALLPGPPLLYLFRRSSVRSAADQCARSSSLRDCLCSVFWLRGAADSDATQHSVQ